MKLVTGRQYQPSIILNTEEDHMNPVSRAVQQHRFVRYFFLFALIAFAMLILNGCGGSDSDNDTNHSCPNLLYWNGSACVEDTTPPTLKIIGYTPGTTYTISGIITLQTEATDNETGIQAVQYHLDRVPFTSAIVGAPYSFRWNTATVQNGVYNLDASAFNNGGKSNRSPTISIRISN